MEVPPHWLRRGATRRGGKVTAILNERCSVDAAAAAALGEWSWCGVRALTIFSPIVCWPMTNNILLRVHFETTASVWDSQVLRVVANERSGGME